ncbi:MAG TPA: CocE/NonD family hydrolase [Candidatus Thermoplasmatota archaeon]|nr:CocE/NonD family hydrolase [Candidatus Thermoplasmatota archaeon]
MRLVPLLLGAVLLASFLGGCLDPAGDDAGGRGATRLGHAGASSKAVFPGQYRFDGNFAQVLAPGPYKVLPQQEVFIKSKIDGKDIQLVNWRPDVPEGMKAPVIIQASPYYNDVQVLAGLGLRIATNFVPHGYVYTQLAIRGTGDAGGCDDFRGPNMVADMHTAIDWLATQPWSNGNVTLIGISYVGTTPWYAAGSGHPAIKTIVPISGSTNAWEVYNRNGSAESRSPIIVGTYLTSPFQLSDRTPQHKAESIPCPETWQAAAIGAFSGVTGEKDPFRAWWDERNAKPKVEKNYKGSVFVIHGFEDWNVDPAIVFPWADELNKTFGLPVKTLVGQWVHTYPDASSNAKMKRWDWAEILLHWFDYYLKGKTQVDLGPAAQLQDNLLRWRNEEHYPPRDANWTTLHLSAGSRLNPAPGAAGSVELAPVVANQDVMRSDPTPVRTSADFLYGPVEKELLISGLPRVHVTVTPREPGGYIAAWLYDRDPATGAEKRIGWTSMSLRYYEGGDKPMTVVPGQPIVAKMEIQPMDAALPAGHQLLLRVWVNTHSDRIPSPPPAVLALNYGGSVKSIVELPIIERGVDAYFEPPQPK